MSEATCCSAALSSGRSVKQVLAIFSNEGIGLAGMNANHPIYLELVDFVRRRNDAGRHGELSSVGRGAKAYHRADRA